MLTASYNPDTATVRLTVWLGVLACTSTISLETYQRRRAEWPGLYPDAVKIEKI